MTTLGERVRNAIVRDFLEKKRERNRISMLTAYDSHSASICDQNGVDVILVGDSLGRLVHLEQDSRGVTVTDMMYHTTIVARGVERAWVVTAMPFGSYETADMAVQNARQLMQGGQAHGLQMEGRKISEQVRAVVRTGVPVMGLVGMDPELAEKLGPYSATAQKPKAEYEEIIQDCISLEKAGCFGLVLRTLPANLAKRIAQLLRIPVIGLGSGKHTDGQLLYFHDMMGITDDFRPRHVKRYAHVSQVMVQGVRSFMSDVERGNFPAEENEY